MTQKPISSEVSSPPSAPPKATPDKEASSESRIFAGHRALGYVSNHVPLVTRYIHSRREHLVVTSVGRVFHTYGCAKLGLLSVSPIHPAEIDCISNDAYHVYTAAGQTIFAWRRGSELKHRYHVGSEVRRLLPFGPHLISVDADNVVKVFDIKTEEMVKELEFPKGTFEISSLTHPATYLNKILLGSTQGSLQLWNLHSMKKIHRFSGWGSAVLCLEQAPAIDVLAVGLQSGEIYVHNFKMDETVMKFSQDTGPVLSLTFRTDGQPQMLSSSKTGDVTVWDLEKRRMTTVMKGVHDGAVAGMACQQGEPLLLTNSADNTLKQWIFDLPDGGGRLLRIKEGHAEPPTRIRFYGAQGTNILSAGDDSSLRSFSTVTDLLNKSLGVASFNRKLAKKHRKNENSVKMEPIVDFTTETTRDRDWANIACVHRATTNVTTWSFGHSRMEETHLRHPRFKTDKSLLAAHATCVCLSVCGNFVLIGYDSGHVDKYNVQSGIHRGALGEGTDKKGSKTGRAHPAPVRGICTDGLNQLTITGDATGTITFWPFAPPFHRPINRLHLELGSLSGLQVQRNTGLLAAYGSHEVVLVDAEQRKVVRRFEGCHGRPLTDVAFSPDARWLMTASLDATVKVWDIPSGTLVDHIQFPRPVSSLSMSPKADFLATAHVGDLGVYLWTNRTLYSHISLRPIKDSTSPRKISLPVTSSTSTTNIASATSEPSSEEDNSEEMMDIDEDKIEFASPEQLASELVTLAQLPHSRWANLLHLDVIKKRNKPKQAVVKPKEAPFFLPTVQGLETRFDLSKESKDNDDESEDSKKKMENFMVDLTVFGKRLLEAETKADYTSCLSTLLDLGPSAIDLEITSLSPENGGTPELMVQFLLMLLQAVRGRAYYEAAQAYLALFLKTHADAIMDSTELQAVLTDVQDACEAAWDELDGSLVASATLVAFYKNALIC